ncbi:MAG: hypothetical protein V8Q75_03340 [Bacilli bacterium]
MKKKITDAKKEYVIVEETSYVSITFNNNVFTNKITYVNKDELIDYIKKHGQNGIKCVFKNEPVEIETIINIKD